MLREEREREKREGEKDRKWMKCMGENLGLQMRPLWWDPLSHFLP